MANYEDEDEMLIETKPEDFDFVEGEGEAATCCWPKRLHSPFV